MRALLALVSLIVPRHARLRWREEWLAEMQHGGRRMIAGALPDAWALRTVLRQASKMARRPGAFHGVDQDVRYAVRSLIAAPSFSLCVLGSLIAGIAVTATAFLFLNAVLFRPLPAVVDQHRLVVLDLRRGCGWPGCSIASSTVEDYRDLREGMTLLEDELAAVATALLAVGINGQPHSMRASLVSENYMRVLGVQPVLGRDFRRADGSAPEHAVIVGHGLWLREFGGDRAVLGRYVALASGPAQIIGVAPPDFAGGSGNELGTRDQGAVEIWVPLWLADQVSAPLARTPAGKPRSPERHFRYFGRLRPGVEQEQVGAQAQVVAAQIAAHRPREGGGAWVNVGGVTMIRPSAAVPILISVLGVPAIVLLIACLNAANLLVARGASRSTELSVRLALGATRWRVVRQLLVESVLLSVAAAAASLILARWLATLVPAALDVPMPVDHRVLAFTAGLAIATAIGFSLLPALRLAAADPAVAVGSTRAPRARSRGRRALVVAQVALSLGLLATGTQLITFVQAEAPTAGVASDKLVLASFDVKQLAMNQAEGETFYRELLHHVAANREIEAAGLARKNILWTFGQGKGASPIVVWRPDEGPRDGHLYLGGYVGGNFFGATGLRILEGRPFTAEDATGSPRVAMVNRPLADSLFDGTPVLGRLVRVAARGQPYEAAHDVTIVGIVEAAREPSYSSDPVPSAYVPAPLEAEPALTLYVRARSSGAAAADAIRRALKDVDPRLPALEISTLESIAGRQMRLGILAARGVSILGLLALALAAAGLYAVMSYLVHLRSREIGIRLAVGADRGDVLRLVLREASGLIAMGSAIGLLGAFVITKIEESEFRGIAGLDLTAFVLSTSVLALAMLLAAAVPARRAARIDPITVLRTE